jgi:TrmH family RNA methyltransferase
LRVISSRDNPLFKQLSRLGSSSRERRKTGKLLLDGMHLVEAYCLRFGAPDAVIVDSALREAPEIAGFLARHPQLEPVVFSTGLFQDVAQVAQPTGIIAICAAPQAVLPKSPPECCVLLEGIQDPGNLGSILRSAAAAGIGHAFLDPACAFGWSPKTLRAGMGAHFALAIHEHADLPATARWFEGDVVATLPRAARSVFDTDVSGRTAWLFGGEGEGLSPEAQALATQSVAIPMIGGSESLNVAAAAAICFFERQRQRGTRTQ